LYAFLIKLENRKEPISIPSWIFPQMIGQLGSLGLLLYGALLKINVIVNYSFVSLVLLGGLLFVCNGIASGKWLVDETL
jgi:hypothetical protein